ncbi:MAG: O-antigen ligase family protein [Flavobacteriaceae bacterium]|nr:O-antigen ligase family protein [Flavobacteriaceae bacterium]
MYAGLGNHAESLAFVLLLIKEKTSILFLDIKPKVKKILLTIIAISVFLFFSRTDVGIIILMVLAIKGYLNFSPKFFFYIFVFILTSFTFYAVLENLNPSRDSKGIEFFVFKIRNSVDEIFNSKINTHNDAELWNRWRAYEAKCAIDQTIDKGPATILFGNGFGGLVDIHRVVNLGGTEMRYIPTLHNGFAYIFFKTGFVGLALFLLFFFIELLKNQQNLGDKNLKYFFTALIMSILIMTLVIGGIYGGASLFLFFLGCIYGLKNTE